MVRYWPTPEKLGALVLPALLELIDEHPRPGWVRRDPQVFATITAQASRRGAPAKPELHPTKWADNEELVTVRPEWGRTEYDRAFVANLIRNDSSAAEKISNQYVESGANSEEERATWLAEAELHRLIFRVHGDIRRLRHSQSGTRRAPMWRLCRGPSF